MRNPVSRTDRNQAEIAHALIQAGASVTDLHIVGRGCPDLLVSKAGKTWVFEVKMPGESLTAKEIEWLNEWQGEARVVYSAEQALQIIQEAG